MNKKEIKMPKSIYEILKEDISPRRVTGRRRSEKAGLNLDDPGTSAGRADALLGDIKKGTRGLGFDVDDLNKQKTIAQLKENEFEFVFSIFWPKKSSFDDTGFLKFNANGEEIDGERVKTVCEVKNPDPNTLILTTKKINGKDISMDIIFIDPKQIWRTYGADQGKLSPGKGGKNLVPLLEEDLIYKVQIDADIISKGGEEDGDEEDDIKDDENVPVPEEITSGKNRNEIFRLLLKNYGNYSGDIIYGDGFKDIEMAKAYGKLQRDVKAGRAGKEKLKEFREKANRDPYSMMIANLRKSFPNNFLSNLQRAFDQFNIQFDRQNVGESYFQQPLLEEEQNPDKYKRWNLVFPGKVVGAKTIDNLDKNIIKFMAAVKKWFAVPVMGPDGKKRSYSIDYDEDKVKQYWNTFYGNQKNESKLNILNLLSEILSEGKKNKTVFDLKIESIVTSSTEKDTVSSGGYSGGGGGKSKGSFVDAIIVKAANYFTRGSGKINGTFDVKPGYANIKSADVPDKIKNMTPEKINLNLEYDNGYVLDNSIIQIVGDPKGINSLLEDVIKSGDMQIKKSNLDPEWIILYYPSRTSIASRINNKWEEILK